MRGIGRTTPVSALILGLAVHVLPRLSNAAEKAESSAPLGAEPLGSGYLIELIVGLMIVLAAVFLLAWVLRRMGNFSGSLDGSMKVVGGLSVGQRERVVLIQVGETQLLIGVAPGSVQRLHQLDEPLSAKEFRGSRGGPDSFAEKLASVLKRGRGS